ncbi:BC1872 family protein [Bacillus wiedmannii]|uniref:BC1872 family protein n=1 Tax=Bacillus wiedmannii TaxID=1890302 RepID=UPI003D20B04C
MDTLNTCKETVNHLVATKILGWEFNSEEGCYYEVECGAKSRVMEKHDWNPIANMSQAWKVIEHFTENGYTYSVAGITADMVEFLELEMVKAGDTICRFYKDTESFFVIDSHEAVASTSMEAICVAGIQLARGEVSHEHEDRNSEQR